MSNETNNNDNNVAVEEVPEDPTIIDPNKTLNDGKTYLITKRYEKYEDSEESTDYEPMELDLDSKELEFTHCRIATIKNFNVLNKTEFLGLRNNLINKIEGLTQLITLRELELYDNQIEKIENLSNLINLE